VHWAFIESGLDSWGLMPSRGPKWKILRHWNLYSYVQNHTLVRTDPTGHSPACPTDQTCITVVADAPPLIPLLRAGGHHFFDQSLLKSKDAWNSFAGQFFRRWSTGKLPNPGLHRGFSTPHRLNSAQIKSH
jgi:hypothetical protein